MLNRTGIRFVAVNGRVPDLMRAEVAQATEHPIEWIDTESDVTVLAHLAAAFPGKPPRDQSAARAHWRRQSRRAVAGCDGAALQRSLASGSLLMVASETVRGIWASHRAVALTAEIEALYRPIFRTIGASRTRTNR